MASASIRWLPAIGLLALACVGAFWLGRGNPVVALSAVSVLLIVGSLYLMFARPGAADGRSSHGGGLGRG